MHKIPEQPPARVIPFSSKSTTQSFAAQQRARPQALSSSARSTVPRSTSMEIRQTQQRSLGLSTSSSRPMIKIPDRVTSKVRKLESRVAERIADVEDRLAADMEEQLNQAEAERRSHELQTPAPQLQVSLFSSGEKLETLSGRSPTIFFMVSDVYRPNWRERLIAEPLHLKLKQLLPQNQYL